MLRLEGDRGTTKDLSPVTLNQNPNPKDLIQNPELYTQTLHTLNPKPLESQKQQSHNSEFQEPPSSTTPPQDHER